MLQARVDKAVGEESPDLVSFARVIDEYWAEGGGSAPRDGNTKACEVDAVVNVDGDVGDG